jgi:NitT/TauT family transport system permease protein
LLLLAWELCPRLGVVDPFLLPPLSLVLERLFLLVQSGKLFVHLVASFQRSFGGFVLALLFSIPAGFLIAWSRSFRKYVDPVLQVFRSIPILALYPVFILFFGLGEASKISVIFYGSLWPTLLNTITGVNGIDPLLVKSARSMGISSIGLFFKVILPSALPSIFTGIRLSAASAILLLIAAEMLGARRGMGYLIFYSEEKFDIPEMFGGILVIAFVGLLLNYTLVYCEKRLTVWKQAAKED